MAIFKALGTEILTLNKANLFIMYYFIEEYNFHYSKILNEQNQVIFECNSLNIEEVIHGLNHFINNIYKDIEWLSEVKFDAQTIELLERLRNGNN